MENLVLVTLHLLAAIFFVGSVFFEVTILGAIGRPVGPEAMRAVEGAIGRRARRVMPFVILVLYAAGITMAWQYRDVLAHPFDSGFATLLALKIALALSVLGHFIAAVTLGARGKLRSRQVRFIHISVFIHVMLIVILAKTMFYVA